MADGIRLPTAEDIRGKVQPRQRPTTTVPRDAFGDFSGMESAAKSLMNFAVKSAQEDAESDAQDLSNKLNAYAREAIDGTPDTPGFNSLQGQHAIDSAEQVQNDFEAKREELLKSAKSGESRRLFSLSSGKRLNIFAQSVATHVTASRLVRDAAVHDGTVAEAGQNLVADPHNTAGAGGKNAHVEDIRRATFDFQLRKTGDGKAARSLAESAVSTALIKTIDTMSISDPLAAVEYLKKNRKLIDNDKVEEFLPALMLKAREQQGLDDVNAISGMVIRNKAIDLNTSEGVKSARDHLEKKYVNDATQLAISRKALEAKLGGLKTQRVLKEREDLAGAIKSTLENPTDPLSNAQNAALMKTTGGVNWRDQRQRNHRGTGTAPITMEASNKATAEVLGKIQNEWSKDPSKLPSPEEFRIRYQDKMHNGVFQGFQRLIQQMHNANQTALKEKEDSKNKTAGDVEALNTSDLIIRLLERNNIIKSNLPPAKQPAIVGEVYLKIDEALKEASRLKAQTSATGNGTLRDDEKRAVIEKFITKTVWVDDATWGDDSVFPAGAVREEDIDGERVYVPFKRITTDMQMQYKKHLEMRGYQGKPALIEELAAAARRGPAFVVGFFRQPKLNSFKLRASRNTAPEL